MVGPEWQENVEETLRCEFNADDNWCLRPVEVERTAGLRVVARLCEADIDDELMYVRTCVRYNAYESKACMQTIKITVKTLFKLHRT